jgi:hypothetical protein
MTTKKLILYSAIIIVLLLLASILTGCAPCDWQATNCPIQNVEKEVLQLNMAVPLLGLGLGRFSRRKIATWIVIAMTLILSACSGNWVAQLADPVQDPVPVVGAQPVSLR